MSNTSTVSGKSKISARPDLAAVMTSLRRYAHFEDPPVNPPPPATPPTGTPPVNNGGNGEPDKKFTQADLDRIAGETRQKATDAARKKVFEELGIEDPAADAELLKQAKAKREADKTELERLGGEAQREKERAEKLQADLDTERQARIADRLENVLLTQLREQGAKDPELSLIGLRARKPKDIEALVGEDGTVDAKKAEALVTQAKKDYADQFGAKSNTPGSGSHSGGRSPDPTKERKEQGRAELRKQIRNRF